MKKNATSSKTTPEKRQVNVLMPIALHQTIRVMAAERGVNVSSLVAEALTSYLAARGRRAVA